MPPYWDRNLAATSYPGPLHGSEALVWEAKALQAAPFTVRSTPDFH